MQKVPTAAGVCCTPGYRGWTSLYQCSAQPFPLTFATKTPLETLVETPMWWYSNDRVTSKGPHAPHASAPTHVDVKEPLTNAHASLFPLRMTQIRPTSPNLAWTRCIFSNESLGLIYRASRMAHRISIPKWCGSSIVRRNFKNEADIWNTSTAHRSKPIWQKMGIHPVVFFF